MFVCEINQEFALFAELLPLETRRYVLYNFFGSLEKVEQKHFFNIHRFVINYGVSKEKQLRTQFLPSVITLKLNTVYISKNRLKNSK